MSLSNLDFFTSKEGQFALSVCLTEYINQLDKHPPETMEDYDIAIEETLKALSKVVGDNKEVVSKALTELSVAQNYARLSIQTIINFSGGQASSMGLIGGLLYAAANMATIQDKDSGQEMLSKRDFIRLAVLMYDLYQVVWRNRTMLETGIRIQ